MTVDDFRPFYAAVHGHAPFDWQERLLRRVVTKGWPPTIALPTSSGKTSAIDIAVFHLALEAGLSAMQRSSALRTFFVIDRRVVVDEAGEHAEKIALALRDAGSPILAETARQLLRYGGEAPLEVSTMRGGMYRDNSWADEPNQPLVCVSTVDQAGSRLLFRGYQVGDSSRPIHAGLIGNDSVMLLDEAHLSTAFRDTVADIRDRYMKWADRPPAKPLRLVEMSATIADPSTFALDQESIAKDTLLAARLGASKLTELREPKRRFEDEMAAAARELASGPNVSVVGVVVNTVGSARSVFEELRTLKGADAVLLTGRNRPYCAKKLWDRYKDRIAARQNRESGSLLYVVATQTVEVGANIDFDALVTEAAPLDSLRQRFGRLNRLGRVTESKALIVSRPKGDVVYGAATERAWKFLGERTPLNFGVEAMNRVLSGLDLTALGVNSTSSAGPLLFPAHLESWIQTNPAPSPDPAVAPFLHGDRALEAADVQVVWRADLKPEQEEGWNDLVEIAPPISTEALPLPVAVVRNWLGNRHQEVTDVEGVIVDEGKEPRDSGRDQGRPVLRWRGIGKSQIVKAGAIRPGDTIVVPVGYNGADDYGWNPKFGETADIGDKANNEEARLGMRRPRLRVGLLSPEDQTVAKGLIQRLRGSEEFDDDPSAREEIAKILPERFYGDLRVDASGRLITWPYQPPKDSGARQIAVPSEETDEDDGSSLIGNWRSLGGHTIGVVDRARRYAEGCGLARELIDDIVLAAERHDLGKSDERFQSWLYGRPFGGRDELLAKSGVRRTRAENARIKRMAGYPDEARHEAGSVAAVQALGLPERTHDPDLVLYLIGVHHGFGRPFFPVWSEDSSYRFPVEWDGASAESTSGSELARIDAGWVDRFWRLNRRYGYWGLAYLESILRRADCMQSRWEARNESD